MRHGAKVKRCSGEGRTKHCQRRCRRNGAKVKLCNVGGCTNQTNLRKEFCVQEVLMERRSDYKAVKDAYKNKHGKEYAYAA